MKPRRLRLLVVAGVGVLAFVPGRFAYAAIDHPLVGTPYGTALDLCVALVVLCWMASTATRDYSWVDRLWSVLPGVYCLIVAADVGFGSARIAVMAALACLWGARLTFNLMRRDGYRPGNQDYRWVYIREQYHPVAFEVFSAVMVSAGQLAVIWLFTSPIHQAWLHAEVPLGWLGWVILLLLFAVSTRLTERISGERYPGYSHYQAAVPMFVPNPLNPRRRQARAAYL